MTIHMSAYGRLDGDGAERERLRVVCDSVMSARSVRPDGGRNKAAAAAAIAVGDFDENLPAL